LIIGLIGGVIGCGSAYVLLKVFSVGNVGGPLGTIRMPPSVLAETLIVAALIGLFSAMVPASSAARRNIVDALRTVA
jgi:ABC-type antimicrobial peptide transport system permease subunit